jgi:flagellar motor switch protein FliM
MKEETVDHVTQNQVENLLKSLERSTPSPNTNRASGAVTVVGNMTASPAAPVRTTAYDFRRPERVGQEQMRAMQGLHEVMARGMGASISSLLRSAIEVKLVSVDQLTYSEFVYSLDNPTCFTLLKVEPLEGHWVLEISPALAYAFVDRMLGGNADEVEVVRRPLTDIEQRLVGRIIRLALEQVQRAWENVVALRLEIDRTESNPQIVQIVPPNEVVVLVGLELTMGKIRGMMNLCIPYNTIERHGNMLSRNTWVGYSAGKSSEQSRSQIAGCIDPAPIRVSVTLARSRIRTAELLTLNVGDIITTEKEASSLLEVSIQDVPKYVGRPGAYKGKKAIKIENVIEKS